MLQTGEPLRRLTPQLISSLEAQERVQLLALLEERDAAIRETQLFQLYPDTGPLRRELYPKHLAFFSAGAESMERAAVAANRVGKTWGLGGFESALHLTGLYPDWWEGRRFDRAVDWWAAGDTGETTRDPVCPSLDPTARLARCPGPYPLRGEQPADPDPARTFARRRKKAESARWLTGERRTPIPRKATNTTRLERSTSDSGVAYELFHTSFALS